MKQLITTLISILVFKSIWAAGGGHHGDGVPAEVFYQLINVTIFVGIIVWFSKDKIKALFQNRYDDFMRLSLETEKARQELEHKKADIIRRAQTLKATSQESITTAQNDAEKFLQKEIARAREEAQRAGKDVDAQIRDTQAKLIEQLRNEALQMSVVSAEEQLTSLDTAEKNKLAKQFSQRVEGATL